jgi:hypothetical protein
MTAFLHNLLAALIFAVTAAGCVVYEPVPYPGAPASFDRSWNAALGAAQDVGLAVTSADRTSGRIQGRRDTTEITITVTPQADGRVIVKFNATGPGPQEQGLNERLATAYNRRMGR